MNKVCKNFEEHPDKINASRKNIPNIELLHEISDFFDAFSNPTRLKILFALLKEELCTCDLSKIANMSLSAVSHQLRILKDRKIISYRKEGKNVFYKLTDDHIKKLIKTAKTHLTEGEKNET
jgi:DNA-binding transcriptional ArsR family regulator